MVATRRISAANIAPAALAFSIVKGVSSVSVACEPVWVRTVTPSSYASAFIGKVKRVDWIASRIVITPVKRISGPRPHEAAVQFNEWPWRCAHQSFQVGQIVDVFLDNIGDGWAQSPDQINFGQDDVSPPIRRPDPLK
ncbi:MAG TPA: hypothetical protein VGI79_02360 [Caulobacteraceae bacterium]